MDNFDLKKYLAESKLNEGSYNEIPYYELEEAIKKAETLLNALRAEKESDTTDPKLSTYLIELTAAMKDLMNL